MAEEYATYLGKKGYTIFKENLEIKEQELIRKELTISPYVPKNSLLNPALITIALALFVACSISLEAPVVTLSSPKIISSATLPPIAIAIWACSCSLV